VLCACINPCVAASSAALISALFECPFFHVGLNHESSWGSLWSMRLHVVRCAWFFIKYPGISHGSLEYSFSSV